jgi:hypothetical protein
MLLAEESRADEDFSRSEFMIGSSIQRQEVSVSQFIMRLVVDLLIFTFPSAKMFLSPNSISMPHSSLEN